MKHKGFPTSLLAGIVCQYDAGELRWQTSSKEKCVRNGAARCSECEQKYEVRDGILFMLKEKTSLPDIQKSEMQVRDKEAKEYDRRLSSRYYREVVSTINTIGDVDGRRVVEYGCGTGRVTEHFRGTPSQLLLVDFSLDSLRILQKKEKIKNAGLVCADASRFVTKKNHFDIAVSIQFLEHVPEVKNRKLFLRNVKRTLKPEGRFICSVYHHDIRRRIRGLPKEGVHNGGIYFYYFNMNETYRLFRSCFADVSIRPIDIQLPLTERLKIPQKIRGYISRFLEHVPAFNELGHLLLIDAEAYNESKR